MNANTMAYTLGEAANAAGKAKSTIFKACKDGLISFSRDGRGRFLIEPAELHRVFPLTSVERPPEHAAEQPQTAIQTDAETLKAAIERDFLKREVEQLRTMLNDMKAERDRWAQQAERLALAPPQQPAPPAPLRQGWWPFRRSA